MICFEFFNWETVRCVTGSFPPLENARPLQTFIRQNIKASRLMKLG